MVQAGYSEDDVNIMRNSMMEEGWKTSELLPQDWLFKFSRKVNKGISRGETTSVDFLSPEGEKFASYLRAIKHMEESSKYDEEDVKKLNQLLDMNSRNARLAIHAQEEEDDDEESKDLHPLPEGWRMRVCGRQNYVISPEGSQLNNKRKALQFMIQNNYPDYEVQVMRLAMENDGWKPSEYLPENWKIKYIKERGNKNTDKRMQFLSAKGDLINSFLGAMTHLAEDGYSQEDIENVNKLLEENGKSSRLSINNDASAKFPTPPGWKIRVCGKHRLG